MWDEVEGGMRWKVGLQELGTVGIEGMVRQVM